MAMLQWIIENNRYNNDYVSSPNFEAAKANGFNSYTNATYLVIEDKEHPNYRKLVRAEDIGLPTSEENQYLVIDKATGKPVLFTDTQVGELFFDGHIEGKDGKKLKVKTSFLKLKESAFQYDMEKYSKDCGIPVETIIELAKEFTSHGTKVAIQTLGSTRTTNGSVATWAYFVLSAMVGSFGKRGGMNNGAPSYKDVADGPRYDLKTVSGKPSSSGIPISRAYTPYESTPEYREKVAKGQNPYPATAPWFPLGDYPADNQAIFSIINKYPYSPKIVLSWMANPLVAVPGASRKDVIEKFKDPENIPLLISLDAYMGETSAISDYIIPDFTPYESWGVKKANSGAYVSKSSQISWPVVKPKTAKIDEKRYSCFENYVIDVSKKLNLPGFGENAISDTDGKLYPLNSVDDFYLRAIANIAYDEEVVPTISKEEIEMQNLENEINDWKKVLSEEEAKKVAYVISRGGRINSYEDGFEGDNHKFTTGEIVNFYMEKIATSKNSYDGEYYDGVIGWYPEKFADGTLLTDKYPEEKWPFKLGSHKAKFRSSLLANSPLLRELGPTNFIELNTLDAQKYGFKDGDKVKIISATGSEATGTLQVRAGVARGTIGLDFGYGHWEYGSRDFIVDGKKIKGNKSIATGISQNSLSLIDPTITSGFYSHSEASTGAPNTSGGAFRLEKI